MRGGWGPGRGASSRPAPRRLKNYRQNYRRNYLTPRVPRPYSCSMNRQDVIAKMEQAIADQEVLYARSLRRVRQAVAEGIISDDDAEDRPGLRSIEARINYLRGELAKYTDR